MAVGTEDSCFANSQTCPGLLAPRHTIHTDGWVPYPFLNPAKVAGYGGVAAYAIGIAVAFVLVGWVLFAIAHRLRERTDTRRV